MTLDIYKSVLSACPTILRPIIRILLRSGITFKQFSKVCRDIFVEVATQDFGIGGRKTNISRVAIIPGISRSEVTRIRKKFESSEEENINPTLSNASRLLTGWHLDEDYIDENGEPMDLTLEGRHPSFTTLMNKYGGDIPLKAMLKEIKQANAIEVLENEKIRPLTRYYMPTKSFANRIASIAETFVDIGNTSYHNFVREVDTESRLQGRAFNHYVDRDSVEDFNIFIRDKGNKLLEEADKWLSEHEVTNSDNNTKPTVRLGLGIYLIQDPENEANQK